MMSNVRIFSFISVISIRVIHGVGINIFDDKFAKIAMCLPAIFNIRMWNLQLIRRKDMNYDEYFFFVGSELPN